MKIIAKKTNKLSGTVIPPASKSHTIRGLVIAVLARGTSILKNPLASEDTDDAVRACRALGAKVVATKRAITVTSRGVPLSGVSSKISTGNSGITAHFTMPLLGLRSSADRPVTFDCGPQMKKRPIGPLVKALTELGMHLTPSSGNLPLRISGTLQGGASSVNGLTSQYLSALLLSLPCAPRDSVITVENLHERPYARMTEQTLEKSGIRFSHSRRGKKDTYRIPGGQRYKAFSMSVPGDFSSASYIIAAAVLIPGTVAVRGLDMDDAQGDKELIPILISMGASIKKRNGDLVIRGGKPLKGRKIDANAIPDLVPTLVVVATQAEGKTDIVNVAQARIKETDRLHSMSEGLQKLGARVVEHHDGITVYRSNLTGASVRGFGDHRTVMALSLAGMLAEGTTSVNGAEAVRKTFPGFVPLMKKLGANIKSIN